MVLTMLLATAVAAGPSAVQPILNCEQIDRAIIASRAEPVPEPRQATDVQLSAHHSLCGGWEIIDFWQSFPRTSVAWHARRKVMNPAGRLTVSITDSPDCPALIPVLTSLDAVPVSLTVIPPRRSPTLIPPAVAPADGTSFTLRVLSARQPDQSTAMITLSNDYGPIATWAEAAQEQLKSCWHAPA